MEILVSGHCRGHGHAAALLPLSGLSGGEKGRGQKSPQALQRTYRRRNSHRPGAGFRQRLLRIRRVFRGNRLPSANPFPFGEHFDAGHLITRIPEYATENPRPMQIVASGACLAHMSEKLAREEEGATLLAAPWREKLGVEIVRAAHGNRLRYKNYEILCLESAHDSRTNP